VRTVGLEPTPPIGDYHLKVARKPIPPRPHLSLENLFSLSSILLSILVPPLGFQPRKETVSKTVACSKFGYSRAVCETQKQKSPTP
jgi:hypothetical protein